MAGERKGIGVSHNSGGTWGLTRTRALTPYYARSVRAAAVATLASGEAKNVEGACAGSVIMK